MKLKPAASTCSPFEHHPLVKSFQSEQKVSKKNSPTRSDLGNVCQGDRSNPDPTAPSLLLSPGIIIYPPQRDDPSASKPVTKRRKYSLHRSLSSPSSTSHSTASLLKSSLESWSQFEAANRSSVHSGYKYLHLHGKKTEPEAVETAENEGSKPVQISQVTQDLQDEPKSLKIYPDGDDTDICRRKR